MIPDSLWVMLLLLVISIVLAIALKEQKNRIYVIFGTLFGLTGDVFLGIHGISWRAFAGGAAFLVEHIIYIVMLFSLIKKEKLKIFNIGFYIGIIFFVITTITIEALAFTVVKDQNIALGCLVPFYILGLSLNLALNFSYSYQKKGTYYFFALGMLIFFVTDIWVFLNVLHINGDLSKFIWYFYQIGQLLLIIFNNELDFKSKKVS
ncbi:MAG: lysoplasmalogenase family protein [Bacilli bacterium]|nr:lysoplasmalogenase family protein [Bacilli bacterium]